MCVRRRVRIVRRATSEGAGSAAVDVVEDEIRRLLQSDPWMPTSAIAKQVGGSGSRRSCCENWAEQDLRACDQQLLSRWDGEPVSAVIGAWMCRAWALQVAAPTALSA